MIRTITVQHSYGLLHFILMCVLVQLTPALSFNDAVTNVVDQQACENSIVYLFRFMYDTCHLFNVHMDFSRKLAFEGIKVSKANTTENQLKIALNV